MKRKIIGNGIIAFQPEKQDIESSRLIKKIKALECEVTLIKKELLLLKKEINK